MNPPPLGVVDFAVMTSFFRTLSTSVVLAIGLALAGCGSPELGEPCDTAGAANECVEGALCTNESSGNVCRKVCEIMDDCPMDYSCNGVSGTSTKSCQPDAI